MRTMLDTRDMTSPEEVEWIESIASPDTPKVMVGSFSDETRDPPAHVRPDSSLQTSSKKSARTRSLRSGIRAEVSYSEDVETGNTQVRAKDIIKIFSSDDDFIEVSREQVNRVKQMHKKIDEGVNFSFNYNVLLLVASVLAGLGLVSNSSVTIIASMLVSPIMGPVVGLAYGTTIRDWKLVRRSLRNESISLLACIVMGITIAACTAKTSLSDSWPTNEMASRTTLESLFVALPVAFFSGLGVAVSLLDDQTSSMVGVAISASLLPPAVNAGVIGFIHLFTKDGVADPLISLCITLANIALIWLAGMLMFRVKEVLPVEKSVFWEDLRVARKLYQRKALMQIYTASGVPKHSALPAIASTTPLDEAGDGPGQ